MSRFAFDNTYARELPGFYAAWQPATVPAPRLLFLNDALAAELGLDAPALHGAEGASLFAGNVLPEGAEPIAQAYAGHQFGHYSPQLGDGRALLLGEVIDRRGRRRDIAYKGSGRTPFSRGGDGRAAVGPVLREYIVSEAMAALNIPTTRSLAAVTTGEPIWRDGELPGAVLTRVASSHIRVGTFQFFAARGDTEALRLLADHVIERHYPEARESDQPYRVLFERVIARQASLVAKWLLVGFIHGVMNTDNCSIAGETIDYGPCAFMDAYNPETVFSSIDHQGRYAYAHQPSIAHWNLARFGETLLPLLAEDSDAALAIANEVLPTFRGHYVEALIGGLRAKLGLTTEQEGDSELAQAFLNALTEGQADFTLAFRRLGDAAADPVADSTVRGLFENKPEAFDEWAVRWRQRMAAEPMDGAARKAAMDAVNPIYIPRNHRVEAALTAAAEREDYAPFEELLTVLAKPYEARPEFAAYEEPPPPDQRAYRTFCGT